MYLFEVVCEIEKGVVVAKKWRSARGCLGITAMFHWKSSLLQTHSSSSST
jgi:hypothetical protein